MEDLISTSIHLTSVVNHTRKHSCFPLYETQPKSEWPHNSLGSPGTVQVPFHILTPSPFVTDLTFVSLLYMTYTVATAILNADYETKTQHKYMLELQ
jgi:hypothetical protein